MLSILTLTYQRRELLEEAIHSFLLQLNDDTEMVIINDSDRVRYSFDHPNIKIYNCKPRFSSIGKKLEYGFTKCSGDWIYRLDDDDLLSPYALELVKKYTSEHPDVDIVRDEKHYFFANNTYKGLSSSINTGNCYKKEYIKRVGSFIDKSMGEDNWLTFHNDAKIHIEDSDKCTMIYRWGMGTYHISGMGDLPNEQIYKITDRSNTENGVIKLDPKFKEDYWSQIK
jgi:glycosyltransferase involved in cell wall biosynthesis